MTNLIELKVMNIYDIKRLNYIKYTAMRPLIKHPHSLVVCFAIYFVLIIKHICLMHLGKNGVKEVLLIAPSQNNRKTIKTIIQHLPDNIYTIWDNFDKNLPMASIYTKSLLHLHLFAKLYFHSDRDDRRLIRMFYLDFLTAISTYECLEKLIINNRNIKLIVFANDHVLINRCLIEISEKQNIKSLYVQHASVTECFPPLRFDFSFLDGQESYDKYYRIGNMKGISFLTGSPRFDAFSGYGTSSIKYDVGIALNELDSIEKVMDLCKCIKANYSEKIIVRPHPAMMDGSYAFDSFKELNIDISDPTKDLSFVFLSEIKVMIANESAIHLDAALMHKPSFLYNFSDNDVMDWYSYIRKGLIKNCLNYDEVLESLKSNYNLPDSIVRYYAASYKSPIEGKVGEFVATFINKMINESVKSSKSFIEETMKISAENPGLYVLNI